MLRVFGRGSFRGVPRLFTNSSKFQASPLRQFRTFAPQFSTPKSPNYVKAPLQLDKERTALDKQIIRTVARYMWPKGNWGVKTRVVLALSLLIAGKLLNIEVPMYFKRIVDEMNVDWSQIGTLGTSAVVLVISYGLARFGATVFGELRNAIFATVGQKAVRMVSYETFRHLLKLDHNFHLNHSTGQLTRAIDRGCKGISYVLQAMVFHIVPITLEVGLVGGILSYYYGISFATVTLATMAVYALFTIRTTTWRAQFRRRANRADNKSNGIATEALVNFESVKLFNNEKYVLKKFDNSLHKYETESVKIATSLAYLNIGQNFIFSSALTMMMYLTCEGLCSSALTVGDLIFVNQLVFQLSVPLNFLGSVYRDMKQAFIDMQALFTLRNYEVTIDSNPETQDLIVSKGEIKFENVSFAYRENLPIMKNLSFTIPAGKRVAFVGPSGSGKSTILRLLFRFYEPQEGRILIDGQDIRDVSLDSLRASIGVVPQDTPLFNDSIANNIRFGRVDASDEQVVAAVNAAELTNLVKRLPEGLETTVGERGLMISGGERQRIAVARVLLKNSRITFFDEATSALDTETEQSLLRNIKVNLTGTGIFIAHRLRTVADTNLIIVLRNGEVAEQGTHSELLRKPNGLYTQLWTAQEQFEEDEVKVEQDKEKLEHVGEK